MDRGKPGPHGTRRRNDYRATPGSIEKLAGELGLPPRPSVFKLQKTRPIEPDLSHTYTRNLLGFSDTVLELLIGYGFIKSIKEGGAKHVPLIFKGMSDQPTKPSFFRSPTTLVGQNNTLILAGKVDKELTIEKSQLVVPRGLLTETVNDTHTSEKWFKVPLGEIPTDFDGEEFGGLLGQCTLRISRIAEINGDRVDPKESLQVIQGRWDKS